MRLNKIIVLIILLLSPLLSFAAPKLTTAENCLTLICVRNNIDLLDQQIVNLLGKRLTYVKRAAEIKGDQKKISDPKRERQILISVRKLAEKQGYPASFIVKIFKSILKQSTLYERSQLVAQKPL